MNFCHWTFYFHLEMKNWGTGELRNIWGKWPELLLELTVWPWFEGPLSTELTTIAHLLRRHIWPHNSTQRHGVHSRPYIKLFRSALDMVGKKYNTALMTWCKQLVVTESLTWRTDTGIDSLAKDAWTGAEHGCVRNQSFLSLLLPLC